MTGTIQYSLRLMTLMLLETVGTLPELMAGSSKLRHRGGAVMTKCSEIIKAKRLERGLSQGQLGKAVGISKVMVCHWEQGHCLPSLLNAWDLADFFGCSIDELCGRAQ